mmetsp:Transcript_23891/g.57851  ORF Transcript_23891/g.57851 Transcript_23891/m.57851 type:complete len:103 (+) Transcript_23891:23-331(+)
MPVGNRIFIGTAQTSGRKECALQNPAFRTYPHSDSNTLDKLLLLVDLSELRQNAFVFGFQFAIVFFLLLKLNLELRLGSLQLNSPLFFYSFGRSTLSTLKRF